MPTNNKQSRRSFIKTGAKAGLAASVAIPVLSSFAKATNHHFVSPFETPYTQQPLPYDYKALEPVIDTMTMEIHYSKHAAAYAKNLAEAVAAEKVDTQKTSLENLLAGISKYTSKMRNNAGGHYNHELFWKIMTTPGAAAAPTGTLLKAIEKDFNSFDAFKTAGIVPPALSASKAKDRHLNVDKSGFSNVKVPMSVKDRLL